METCVSYRMNCVLAGIKSMFLARENSEECAKYHLERTCINTPMCKIESILCNNLALEVKDYDTISTRFCACSRSTNCGTSSVPISIEKSRIPEAEMIVPTKLGHSTVYGGQNFCVIARPSFVFCQVIKPRLDYPIGLGLVVSGKGRDRIVKVCKIDQDGLFARTGCIQSGDELIAINGISVSGLSMNEVNTQLRKLSSTLSITVKNKSGDPNLFLSSIEKPTKGTSLGIHLRNIIKRGNILIIDDIADQSIFSNSLLSIGHQIVSINDIDCSILRANDVKDLIMSTHSGKIPSDEKQQQQGHYHVNIVSRVPSSLTNMVATIVSCDPVVTNGWQLKKLSKLKQKRLN